MRLKFLSFILLSPVVLNPVLSFANTLPISNSSWGPLISISAGLANINADSQSQINTGDDGENFIYNSPSQNKTVGLAGIFLGAQHDLPHDFFIETGLEYNYFGSMTIRGDNTTGIDSDSSTAYSYDYKLHTQQFLAVVKLLTQVDFFSTQHPFYPYVSLGLGAALNQASGFESSTQETGSVNLTPGFNSHTETNFSYSLGLGFEMKLSQNMTAGLGYEFAYFGKNSLGQGQVNINNYSAPTNFNLAGPKTYANQLKAQISYFF